VWVGAGHGGDASAVVCAALWCVQRCGVCSAVVCAALWCVQRCGVCSKRQCLGYGAAACTCVRSAGAGMAWPLLHFSQRSECIVSAVQSVQCIGLPAAAHLWGLQGVLVCEVDLQPAGIRGSDEM
jgi:hypothetical protein